MSISIRTDYMIPLEPGQAISKGWTDATNQRPMGVTWHWTATWDLATCRRVLGGPNAERKGVASAQYAVGRGRAEGVDCYVSLEDRAWHAGINQTLGWDGQRSDETTKGSRTTIGIETVNIGYARSSVAPQADWIKVATVDNRRLLIVQPWTEEQLEMMIELGKTVVNRWKHIGMRDHHGHHDICPGYKHDVLGFPFARVLSGIYGSDVPDVWTPLLLPIQRQKALRLLGYDLGITGVGGDGVDGLWGRISDRALVQFQAENHMVPNGKWTTFVCWKVYDWLRERSIDLATI